MDASDCTRTLYLLLDPTTEEVRYVGITKFEISARLAGHVQESYSEKHQSHRARWVRALRKQGLKPIIREYRKVEDGERWQDAEMQAVSHFKAMGARLVNGTAGGDGTTDREWRPNADQRAKMSAFRMGMRPTEETRKKRSESLKRFYEDPEKMKARQDMARAASRSAAGREAASARMKAIWADPVRREEMRSRMMGVKKTGELSPEAREVRSNIAKRLWSDGRFRHSEKSK